MACAPPPLAKERDRSTTPDAHSTWHVRPRKSQQRNLPPPPNAQATCHVLAWPAHTWHVASSHMPRGQLTHVAWHVASSHMPRGQLTHVTWHVASSHT
eukprot:5241026-Prymnesium_polylepis.1